MFLGSSRNLRSTLEHQEIELEDKSYPILQFGPSFNVALPEIESESHSLQELLDVAIEREIVSRQIYSNTAAQVFGKRAQVLQNLAAFEGGYEARLKDLRAFLLEEETT